MSKWTRPAQPVRCVVDLTAPLTVRRERGVLVQGDENANAIVAEVYQSKGVPFDLTGSTVTLTFVRPDKLAVPPITAEITGNVAVMTLTDTCYRLSGMYAASVKLQKGDTKRTIVRLLGDIISTSNDGMVDDEQIFPTPEELLEMLAQVEQARDNANTAASSATTAASSANNAASSATTAASNANTAASSANTAAARANSAAQNWEDGTAANAEKLGGKAPAYYLPAVNLLDNPAFAIAQAGYGGMHGTTKYAADRWEVLATSVTAPTDTTGIIIHNKNGPGQARLRQFVKIKKGTTYTAAVRFRSLSDGTSIRVGAYAFDKDTNVSEEYFCDLNVGTSFITHVFQFCFQDDFLAAVLSINDLVDEVVSYEVMWAALHEGTYTAETLPPFVPPDPYTELLKMREYHHTEGYDLRFIYGGDVARFAADMRAGDFSKIRVGDYWPITLNGTYHDYATDTDKTVTNAVMKMEVAGIDPYWRYGDSGTLASGAHHFALISRDLFPHTLQIRSENSTWYDTTQTNPMLGSHLHQTLCNPTNGIITLVEATELGSYIYAGPNGAGMRAMLEIQAAGEITPTGTAWADRGKLWVPNEVEVWGEAVWQDHKQIKGLHVHFPIFSDSIRHIIKGLGNGGAGYTWWCSSSTSSTYFARVDQNGYPSSGVASSVWVGVPLCFIMA